MKWLLLKPHYLGTTYYPAGSVVDAPEDTKWARGAATPVKDDQKKPAPKKKG